MPIEVLYVYPYCAKRGNVTAANGLDDFLITVRIQFFGQRPWHEILGFPMKYKDSQ